MIESLPINITDLVAFGVIIVSALLAFARGLVREVLSIAAWVIAVLATIYGFPVAKPFLREYIGFTLLADIITGLSIFLVTLIICAAISHMLSRNVRGSGFGALDRSLGLLFGVVRGAVVLSLGYLFLAWAMPEKERPAWMTEARSLPVIAAGADWLRSMAPETVSEKSELAADAAKGRVEQAVQLEKILSGSSAPAPAAGNPQDPAAPEEGSGYRNDERKQLDRLIQGIQ